MLLPALIAVALAGCDDHGHGGHAGPGAAPAPSGSASNAVQAEMRLLSAALEGAVRGIGAGDVRAVEHDLHRVHAAKEATGAALAGGTYRLPKHPDQVERFKGLDEAFHTRLERLVGASQRNDVPGTAEALGGVLQACHGCHTEFRP